MNRVFGILFLLYCGSLVGAKLPDVLKTCRDVDCSISQEYEKYPTFNPEYNYKWMMTGLPMIFWDAVRSEELFNLTSMSSTCRNQLVRISDAMKADMEWGYKFLDSSGKPAGLFRSSMTSLGDYDQCLSIDSHGILGKYCMIDMHHLNKPVTETQLSFRKIAITKEYPYFSDLCVPKGCAAREIQVAVREILKPYLIKVAGYIHCDTAESISWHYKLMHLTRIQMTSIVLVLSILILVMVGTVMDIRQVVKQEAPTQPTNLFQVMSLRRVSHKFFYAKPFTFDILVFDSLKVALLFATTAAHIMYCADSPLSFATFSNMDYLEYLWSDFWSQYSVTDTGLLGVPFLSGLAVFSIMYPMAKKKKIPYFAAVIDRILRFWPHIALLTACEFIWPIMGSGPFYTRMADFTLKKCSDNWWYNLIFLNNYFIDGIDICAGHSFWSSVDMHLFLIGLFAMFVFSFSDVAGIMFSLLMIIFGTVKISYNAYVKQTVVSWYYVDPDPFKTNEYFNEIYGKTTAYIPAYFVGFLIAYARTKGYLHWELDGFWRKTFFFMLLSTLFNIVTTNSSLQNTFGIYDASNRWILVTSNRIMQVIAFVALYLFCCSYRRCWERSEAGKISKSDPSKLSLSPFKALSRLCFSLYICNYLYIRYEYFTRRFLHPNGRMWMTKRCLSSSIMIGIFALFFHLLLLGPLDALRDHLTTSRSRRTPERGQKHQEEMQQVPLREKTVTTAAGV